MSKEEKKATVKFVDVKSMFEAGIMGISSRTLDIAHSYKVAQFKTKLKNAYAEYNNRREQLLKDAGIDDSNKFTVRLNELVRIALKSEAEEAELKELKEKDGRFGQLFNEMLKDECSIEPKVMPYDQWRLLLEENKDIKNGNFELLAQFESTLENILWKAPEGA